MIVEDAGKGHETTREIVAIRGRNPDNPSDRRAGITVEQRMEKNMCGLCNTVTTVQKDNMLLETENLYMDGHNYNQRKTVHMPGGVCRTVMGGGNHAGNEPKVVQRYRVRKLTERECGRLMGFRVPDMDRMFASVSRTQAYKQFGNSIVVNCLAGIFSQLGIKDVKRWNGGLKDTFGSSAEKEGQDGKMDEKQRIREFEERIPPIFSEDLKEYMVEGGFFTCPASAGHHGAFEGGNFLHSRMVAMLLREYTDRLGLEWERPESPEIIGWLHDLCKMDEYVEYISMQDGREKYCYKYETSSLPGHGEKSAMMAERFMYLTEEEVYCICWHMGPYTGKKTWKRYEKAVKKYPNILWTHQADMVASNVNGI